MRNVLPEAARSRFDTCLTRLGIAGVDRLLVAVSGGVDSLALLLLTAETQASRTVAATMDHGLRPESADEAGFVAEICTTLGVPHRIMRATEAPTGNLQDWARRHRYAALERLADEQRCNAILTAHQADDQLETMLLRLNRGAGLAGLAGVRARNGRVVRPLLGWRRSELAALVAMAGLTPVDDPSNADPRFDRARMRRALADIDWLDAVAASTSAGALADAEEAICWAVGRLFEERCQTSATGITLNPAGLPKELLRRLVLGCLRQVQDAAATPRGAQLDQLLAALGASRKVTLGGVLCEGGACWQFSPAKPRRKN